MFLKDLSLIPFDIIEIFDDVDDTYWIWNELIMQIVNEHAPIKIKTIKGKRVPYMNGELRRSINVRNMMKRKYEKNNTSINWKNYTKQRNLVTKLRKQSLNRYLANKCNDHSKQNGNEFWETVKPFISHKGNSKTDNIILMKDDKVFTKPNEVVTIFNTYFTNIAKDIGRDDSVKDGDNIASCLNKHQNHKSVVNIKALMELKKYNEFSFQKVESETIRKSLDTLKTKKATGFDMLPSKILKLGCNILCLPICYLVNMSFKLCNFPNVLKCAEISPIYKKGNNMDVSNYRPVSILPIMSKIYEKEMVRQLSSYFENIFSQFISGFRPKHSCETVLLRMVENIKLSLDQGQIVSAIITDLSRAFDSIPYKLFVSKLYAYGLSMSACELMFNYYSNRKQRVKMGNSTSEWQSVYKGSAQGSVIGPLSYNIFSNDMLSILDNDINVYNYADDNTLTSSGYDYDVVQDKLVRNIEKVMQWFEENDMKINPDKFQYIVFGKNESIKDIKIGNVNIQPVNYVKVLGVYLDNKLNFDLHITKLSQKAGRQIQVISRLSRILNESSKMLLYNTFLVCYFQYCSIVWHFCSKINTYKIEKLQYKALKHISRDYNSCYADLLKGYNIDPLFVQRIRKMMESVYKILKGNCPHYLRALCQEKHAIRYDFRAENNVFIPKYQTICYGKKSFKYNAPYVWNSLANDVKDATSLNEFIGRINKWKPVCYCGSCTLCHILNM